MHKETYICDGCQQEIDVTKDHVAGTFEFFSTDADGIKTRERKVTEFHKEAGCFQKWLQSVTSE